MKCIAEANETILSILGQPKASGSKYRLMKYCAQAQVEEGILLYNLLTRELVLLSKSEYSNITGLEYMRAHWFVVDENANEKASVDILRWVLDNTQKPSALTTYTILTTTDCNARCFYCFEKGIPHVNMSEETALKTAQYIKEHNGGEKVRLCWFGGEPLYNANVIDIICRQLRQDGIEFSSTMLTNGYLLNNDIVRRATDLWNLVSVQISLDGTEEVYNKSKNYIYAEGNPYHIVLSNIAAVLDAGVKVSIRLNFDLYNAENLICLVDELADRFAGIPNFSIYGYHLYDITKPSANLHSEEGWNKRYEAMHKLEDRIQSRGVAPRSRIRRKLRASNCGADSGNSIVILPNGDLGLCRDRLDATLVGHIDKEKLDAAAMDEWKKRMPELPECADCFCYPDCIRLKNCISQSMCFRHIQEEKLRKTKRAMLGEYEAWLSEEKTEEQEEIFE